jgi:hypothetical protein
VTWVRQQPWGQHKGRQALLESECGERELWEYMATQEPLADILAAYDAEVLRKRQLADAPVPEGAYTFDPPTEQQDYGEWPYPQ